MMKSSKDPIDPDLGDLAERESDVYESPDEFDQRDSDDLRSSISSEKESDDDDTSDSDEDTDLTDEDDLADVNAGKVTQQPFTFKAWPSAPGFKAWWKDSRSLVSASCPKVDRALRWMCRISKKSCTFKELEKTDGMVTLDAMIGS